MKILWNRKRFIRLALFLGCAGIVVLVYSFFNKTGGSTIAFLTCDPAVGDVKIEVTATGSVKAIQSVDIGTQVSGVVDKLYVDFNSVVKKGELLAELDTKSLKIELSRAEAQLNYAKADLEYQKSNFERQRKLYENTMISQADYELALLSLNKAKATHQSSLAEYNKASANLAYAFIYSPIDGVVIDCPVEEGQTVAASFNTPTIFTIVNDLTQMQVQANIDEADIGLIHQGQKVFFSVDAYSENSFTGVVSEVRLNPIVNNNVVTYAVVINAPNPDKKLMPGMTAGINISIAEALKVKTIPSEALQFDPDEQDLKNYQESLTESEQNQMNQAIDSFNHLSKVKNKIWVMEGRILFPISVDIGLNNGIVAELKSTIKNEYKVVLSKGNNTNQDNSETSSPFMPSPPKK